MTIYGCGFNGFNQLLQYGNGFNNTISENDTCVSTLRKLHEFSNPTESETSGISEHPQSIPLNNAHPKELSLSLSAISVGWDKIAIQFG